MSWPVTKRSRNAFLISWKPVTRYDRWRTAHAVRPRSRLGGETVQVSALQLWLRRHWRVLRQGLSCQPAPPARQDLSLLPQRPARHHRHRLLAIERQHPPDEPHHWRVQGAVPRRHRPARQDLEAFPRRANRPSRHQQRLCRSGLPLPDCWRTTGGQIHGHRHEAPAPKHPTDVLRLTEVERKRSINPTTPTLTTTWHRFVPDKKKSFPRGTLFL